MDGGKPRLLLGAWVVSFALGLVCLAVLAQGVIRDRRLGEPVLPIDLSRTSGWTSTPFRVWGEGSYRLFLSSVNFDSTHVGVPLGADFEVIVVDPAGRPVVARVFRAGSTDHVLPYNYGDSRLAELRLKDWPLRPWRLKARVLAPDPRFRTAQSAIKFWKERHDPGMGGLMNYVMIVPAEIFLGVALILSIPLASRANPAPLIITIVTTVLSLVIFFG
jgi:hypothetical protein